MVERMARSTNCVHLSTGEGTTAPSPRVVGNTVRVVASTGAVKSGASALYAGGV
jgi:hypothetical protein